jgi:thiamine biosynthesis protein ThiS
MPLQVTLNGKPHTVESEEKLSVAEFVSTLEIGKQPVLVERNGEAVFVREFDEHFVEDGDVLEVIRMVAGG